MTAALSDAISAYKTASRAISHGGESRESAASGGEFSAMVKNAVGQSVETVRHAEQMSMKAIAGQADLHEVATAVTAAEVTLETVVAVRDKVIAAYNEIMRMPI
jgi:flagellar hook-basal body complex protein FliE